MWACGSPCGYYPEISRSAAEAVVNLWAAKRDGDAKKTAVFRKIVPADGTIAACWPERNFGTFRYETAAHQNVTPLPQRTKGGERKARSRKEFASTCLSSAGKEAADWRRVRHRNRSARPKRSPDFGQSHNLIRARREALDHGLALFTQIGVPAANGLDGYEHLAPRRQAEKLFGLLADGF